MSQVSTAALLQYRGPQDPPQTYAFPEWDVWTDQKKVEFLRKQADLYAADPKMRDLAVQIFRRAEVEERDYPAMAAALLRFVQDHVYYVEERDEQIFSPWRTLQLGYGDCDDMALLLAALGGSVNLICRFVLLGRARGRPIRWVEGTPYPTALHPDFRHIYCEFLWPATNPRWAASAEPIIKGAPLGFDFALYGVSVDAHGKPFLDPERRALAEKTGIRRISAGKASSPAFGGYPESTSFIKRMLGTGLFGRISEEVAVVIPVTIVSVLAGYAAEKWLLPKILKVLRSKK